MAFEHTYFEEADPYAGDSQETYTDADRPIANRRTYEWNHGIGETVTALLDEHTGAPGRIRAPLHAVSEARHLDVPPATRTTCTHG